MFEADYLSASEKESLLKDVPELQKIISKIQITTKNNS